MKLFKKLKWYYQRYKAKEALSLARFGCRVVQSMYTEEEIKTEGTIGNYQMRKALDEWDKATKHLDTFKK